MPRFYLTGYTYRMTMLDEVRSGEAQLLDVRTIEEWNEEHAEHALHIPINDLLRGQTGPLSPTKKIYVYCMAGGRAGMATEYLKGHGFQAENVGGLSDWLRESNSENK